MKHHTECCGHGIKRTPKRTTDNPADSFDVRGLRAAVRDGYKRAARRLGCMSGFNGRRLS